MSATAWNVWLIVIGEPLPIEESSRALRTRILAQLLAGRGHHVTWWTSDFNHFTKRHHLVDKQEMDSGEGYRLRFLHGRAYKRNLSIDRQLNHNEIAVDFARQAERMGRPDIVICSFPSIELADEAVKFANAHGVPIVVDIRDLWPDEMINRLPSVAKPLGKVMLAPLDRKVARTLRNADAILGVSEAYLDWGLAKAGRQARAFDQVIPLGYPDHPESVHMRAFRGGNEGKGCRFFFSGSFNNSVDLGAFIEAFGRIDDPDLSAMLCGDGDNAARWREMAEADRRITFTGWINGEQIRVAAAEADVGLICYKPESLVAMPNKLFEYLSFGLAVVNAIPGEAAALVEQAQIGRNYKAGSVESLRQQLMWLRTNACQRAAMSKASAQLFESRFSAVSVYHRYYDLVESIVVGQGA